MRTVFSCFTAFSLEEIWLSFAVCAAFRKIVHRKYGWSASVFWMSGARGVEFEYVLGHRHRRGRSLSRDRLVVRVRQYLKEQNERARL
jgi:hypothetical protein